MTVLGKGPSIMMGSTMVMDNLCPAPLTLEKVTRCLVSLILTCSYTPSTQKFYFIIQPPTRQNPCVYSGLFTAQAWLLRSCAACNDLSFFGSGVCLHAHLLCWQAIHCQAEGGAGAGAGGNGSGTGEGRLYVPPSMHMLNNTCSRKECRDGRVGWTLCCSKSFESLRTNGTSEPQ
jgi:hypothetical protein